MRLSCNGCRVLRKGCSDTCSIRPCLEWIKSPQAQANATLFLAKFYGRAGLVNLITAGTPDLRPAIFKSLLYEACGRIVNPVYGSAGLLWTGSWELCQEAVEAVLKGAPIKPISAEDSAANNAGLLPFKASDIRHISKNDDKSPEPVDLQKALMPVRQTRFKRSGTTSKGKSVPSEPLETGSGSSQNGSGLSQIGGKDSDVVSAETVEAELQGGAEVLLELTLGFGFGSGSGSAREEKVENNGKDEGDFAIGLGLA